jgi:hypothetical protein
MPQGLRETVAGTCGLERVNEAARAVVVVETPKGSGSAFFIEPSVLITSRHVVGPYRDVLIELQDGDQLPGEVVAISDALDLAVVRVHHSSQAVLAWGEASSLQAGEEVYAVGYPLGARGLPVVTKGIVSRVGISGGRALIQTDAALNPGNGGGPLLTDCGAVVGVNTLKLKGAEGIGIAIAESDARLESARLLEGTAGRSPDPARMTFTDPFEFCQHVGTIDSLFYRHPGWQSYVGNPWPFGSPGVGEIAWRCWEGKVLGCYTGATGGACMKINESTQPSPELAAWCRSNPNDSFPPNAATGHNTAYEWECVRGEPRITARLIPTQSLDGLGYQIRNWFLIFP